eukprot:CAMPEP_0168830304 /NCGR_PEP_ID=MMETSP0727-20121128/1462_1 /TAXON_ID=265536 /ORGANISM="Amphiprora sp., Strain CCMP467" /LENGTH=140 /DNA_ID=CAMNT_0008883531 /DNA_START=45 /DNA_END=468 /DNA_ORIENTATION=-
MPESQDGSGGGGGAARSAHQEVVLEAEMRENENGSLVALSEASSRSPLPRQRASRGSKSLDFRELLLDVDRAPVAHEEPTHHRPIVHLGLNQPSSLCHCTPYNRSSSMNHPCDNAFTVQDALIVVIKPPESSEGLFDVVL